MNKPIKYIGKAEYCYANSVAMLLESIDETVSPKLIEVLTGLGLGSFFEPNSNLLFFSNLCAEPDEGIDRALKIMGFQFTEKSSNAPDSPPFQELSEVLTSGPAILGPLELGLLAYNPNSVGPIGADHFVLAYAMDKERVYVNDPYGFPQVSLTLDQLKEAWRADSISYKRGYYRYWHSPKRIKTPVEKEIYDSAIESYKELYRRSREKSKQENRLIGSAAILHEADRIREGKAGPEELDFLSSFMLALSASRSLDFADFFDPHNSELATLKRRQAELFGKAHVYVVAKNLEDLLGIMTKLAEIEDLIGGHFI